MRETFSKILALQNHYSKHNTTEMEQRGKLVRQTLPALIREKSERLIKTLRLSLSDFFVEGRDGTGNKTEIPWCRIASRIMSPSATTGWYCVYLFKPDGTGVYLGLSHGSTRVEDGDFKPRGIEETKKLMSWARSVIGAQLESIPTVQNEIELGGRTKLGPAYKNTTVAALYYPADKLPDDTHLYDDLNRFAELLNVLYEAQRTGISPGATSPEIVAVEQIIRPRSGQGFGLSAEERKAVEMCAMNAATQHLEELGCKVKDVSSNHPYDLRAISLVGNELFVEVKGTTSGPAAVLLTHGEVAFMRSKYPNTALALVHGIKLDRHTSPPVASGGRLIFISPWSIDDQNLKPLSYIYSVNEA